MATQPMMQPGELAPVDGPNTQQQPIPQDLQDAIKWLFRKASKRDMAARRREVREARTQRYFWRGDQYLAWNNDDQVLAALPNEDGKIRRVFNIYMGYGKSFIATFCQNAPNTRPEPENPKDPQSISSAAEADKMRRVIEKFNDPRMLQMETARLKWTDQRVVFYTRYVTDKQRFGVDAQGNPRGREVITPYGVLECKSPISLRDIHDWPYCIISTEHDVTTMKAMFPDIADKIQAGAGSQGEEEYDRISRIAATQGAIGLTGGGDGAAYLSTHHHVWFRPSFFNELEDQDKKQALLELFPDGLHADFVGNEYAGAREESLDDHIAVDYSLPGDGQNSPSLGKNQMAPSQAFNDMMNLAEETFQYGVPVTWVDEEAIDADGIADQDSKPGSHIPAKRKTGEPLDANFYTEPPATMAPGMAEYMQDVQGPLSQFLSGQPPALYGGDMEDQKTATGYAQAKNQALGLMAIVWLPFVSCYSRVMKQAVKCAANNRPDSISTTVPVKGKPGKTEPIEVDIDKLTGDILWTTPTDENFPESWTEKSNKFMQLVQGTESNPVLAQLLQHPDNLALAKDMIGLEDLTIPGADSRDKQLQEIAEMVKSEPVPNPQFMQEQQQAQMAMAQGLPAPPMQAQPEDSSVPIDPDFDDHAAEWAECQRWVNSPEGQKAKLMAPLGFVNVRLHGLAHKAQVDAAQAKAAAAAAPPQKPPPDNKPSQSINFKDLPPHGQLQMAAEAGIQLDPQITSAIHPAMQPPPPPPVIKQQPGA